MPGHTFDERVGAFARDDSDLVTGRGDTPLAEERRQSVMAAHFDPSTAFLVRGVRVERVLREAGDDAGVIVSLQRREVALGKRANVIGTHPRTSIRFVAGWVAIAGGARVADDPGEPAVATNGRRDQHRPIRDVTAVHDGLQVLLAAIGSMRDDRVAGGGVESPEHAQGVLATARQQPLRPGPRVAADGSVISTTISSASSESAAPAAPPTSSTRSDRAPRPACHVGGTHDGGRRRFRAKGDIALDAAWTHSDAAQEAHDRTLVVVEHHSFDEHVRAVGGPADHVVVHGSRPRSHGTRAAS